MPTKVSLGAVAIRPAVAAEAWMLSDLALRSKALWGYDADFIRDCRAELTLTPAYILTHPVYVAESGGQVAGFRALLETPEGVELDYLYVEPSMIGAGIGGLLFHHAAGEARRLGYEHLRIHSDPHAEAFYLAMGAVRVGEVPSPLRAGRMLPLLRYSLR